MFRFAYLLLLSLQCAARLADPTLPFSASEAAPRYLAEDKECTYLTRLVMHTPGVNGQKEFDDCDIDGSTVVQIGGPGYKNLKPKLKDLVSGESTLRVPGGAEIVDGVLILPNGKEVVIGRKPKRDRKLLTGPREVLVLRIDAPDSSTSSTEAVLSDNIFGTGSDLYNLRSQYLACSNGQLDFQPTTNALATNGTSSVSITQTVTGVDDGVVRNAAQAAGNAKFGSLSQFDHVMFCIPPGTNGNWIGYAWIGGYRSVYNNNWCNYLSIQMHEIGHNINLHHSGEGASEYNDQSCMMGSSYSSDEGPRMCFNAPKIRQLGWYSDAELDHDISVPGSLPNQGVIGIVDYENYAGTPVLIRLTGGNDDYYVSFNRQKLFSSGTREAGNRVMVHRRPSNGGAVISWLLAKMVGGNSFTFIGSSGLNTTVTVDSIATDIATVSIVTGCASTTDCDVCGGETCVNSVCVSGTQLDCNDNDVCTTDSCSNTFGGCQHTEVPGCRCSVDADCDFCAGQTCVSGVCQETVPDPTCDDGISCTIDSCSNNQCVNTLSGNCCINVSDCPAPGICTEYLCVSNSCESSVVANCCGNGQCEVGEDCFSCPDDCATGPLDPPVCGDGMCDIGKGETCINCSTDCSGRTSGNPRNRYCCGSGVSNAVGCSDSRCGNCSESPNTAYCCGDETCEGPETDICSVDCDRTSSPTVPPPTSSPTVPSPTSSPTVPSPTSSPTFPPPTPNCLPRQSSCDPNAPDTCCSPNTCRRQGNRYICK